ncbi:ATP-dependent DNA helicase [Dinoroseobacter shibae DFL 12 = DSM 16493]|uniref:Probable DNA 3'-5' helicase RecG n=1 Tax=Dinoroseobacter shibae (strain DSM 16493 / NCIMB 14021 / DFL 12) TaxID=398580 RepID=A8LK53_DINSH|nr:ATP-dependent DNA helicase RecG [Dinoroseobacter shibae]ABV93252.1 ATP-dependent DNA helicase [Dinoroseobacter shibae DFL 12 = DSM 16493]URF48172.1 ATP-dependent DNA helicase RecG [Dinoroseobacter shibae]URF52482.1 ATP-dependent DNA helicase RecG [Dinoroseobacter shibae]
MSSRPAALFPLFAELETLPGIGKKTAQTLAHMDIARPRDLIFTLPSSGIERRLVDTVQTGPFPSVMTVPVTVTRHLPPSGKGRPYRIEVADAATTITLVYFHARGDYLMKLLPPGARRIISGRVELYDGQAQMPHPDHVLTEAEAETLGGFEPVYPLTAGITQKTMQKAVAGALDRVPDLAEWADPALVAQEGWPDFASALASAHAPQSMKELGPDTPARRRLAYDELLAHQTTLALARAHRRRAPGRRLTGDGRRVGPVLAALPYTPTGAQQRVISEITEDLAAPHRMNRLLQGDVGAGKTLVALVAMLLAVEAGTQAVMMAPTEILARQHLAALLPLAEAAGVVVEVLTGRDKGRERAAKLAALAAGDIHILVGTHAVFQDDVAFHDLGLAVIDEQHRFGVRERMRLGAKGAAVDVLVMTATPIPRSLALVTYGDMDVSILDEKPPGRTPVKTALVSADRLDELLAHLDAALSEGRQVYWVCPLVEESETLALTAAEERFKHLRARFGEGRVGLVHGQMPVAEKDAAMADFVAGETRLLVATTVIEVGVDVPNASIMVIEGAEHFGLAQLHQLRGRVGRGSTASSCLLLYAPPLGETATKRLKLMRETEDGFRISEADMEMRGAGDLIGTAQSGLPRFRIADLERQAGLMAMAQSDARALLAKDPKLDSPRGEAVRMLLWLTGQDEAIRLISVG